MIVLSTKCYPIAFIVVLQLSLTAAADVPQQLNHQGVVRVNGVPFTGTGFFKFAIVDPDTGNNLWTNDGTNEGTPAEPAGSVSVEVVGGVYSVALGDTALTNMTAVPTSVFNDDNAVLRIWFDDGVNGVQQLTPDHPLTSVPYALHAATASGGLIGEIRMWGGPISAIPPGWLHCDGSEVSRTTFASLFAVLETIYGPGDGSTTFNLPDFRDRSPMGAMQDDAGVPKTNVSGALTQSGGAPTHTLTTSQMPSHRHTLRGQTTFANRQSATGNVPAWTGGAGPFIYHTSAANTNMDSSAITYTGSTQAHNNLHPYFAITFIIFAGD